MIGDKINRAAPTAEGGSTDDGINSYIFAKAK